MRCVAALSICYILTTAGSGSSVLAAESRLELMIGGPPPCFIVFRDGRNIPIIPRMELQNGDIFAVTRNDCQAALRIGDKFRDPVLLKDTPLTIRVPGEPSPIWGALDALTGKLISEFMHGNGVYPKRTGGLLGPMSWPLKDQSVAPQIALFRKQLSIAWAGGVAPFEVRVLDPNGVLACERAGLQVRHALCDLPTPDIGSYEIELKDADKPAQVKIGYLIAVSTVPGDCQGAGSLPPQADDDLEAVERGLSLAKCAGAMQALQIIVPYSDVFAAARWLERYLVGDQP
jgi:hypothetical protein